MQDAAVRVAQLHPTKSCTMKQTSLIVILTMTVFTSLASCNKKSIEPNSTNTQNNSHDTMSYKIKIKTGTASFTATISNSATSAAFKAMLPMTLNMIELNGNEKYADLSGDLPTNASNPGTIQTGDLMIYGSSTLVLFYKSFSTSYNYTELGRIDNPSGLADALGSGNVTVTLE